MVGSVFAIPRINSDGVSPPARSRSGGISARDQVSTPLPHFIGGPENALLELAAASVTDQWVRFNPLFISGPSGVGKTHLLHGLLKSSQNSFADLRSLSLSGADYARAIADGIDVDSISDVRSLHRSVDLFILDGLQELAFKPAAQQELVHTMDAMIEQDAQVIIASQSPLDEIGSLLPALVSRLSSGLQIPLVPPAAATRGVILDELAKQNAVVVPPQVSQQLTSTPRRKRSKPLMVSDLMAAIVELRCFPTQTGGESSTAVDRIASRTTAAHDVTAKEINKRVAKYFNVTVRELTGASRRKTVVRARALSVYLIRTALGFSFQAIGQSLGGRDHTTVMHAFQRATDWIDDDAGFARAVTEVGAAIE